MSRSTLGHYEIIESLGAGGMGEVYRAHVTDHWPDAVDLRLTISDSGDTHTWEGKIAIVGEDADPLNEVWRRVGR